MNGFAFGRKYGLRAALLASASVIALGTGFGAAKAAENQINIAQGAFGFLNLNATGFVNVGTQQFRDADVQANISGAASTLSNQVDLNGLVSGGDITTNQVNTNLFTATATGNQQVNTVDLATLGTINASDGIGILASQLNASTNAGTGAGSLTPPRVISAITGSSDTATLTDFQTGGASVNGNMISAVTTGNTNSSAATGTVPNNYVSTTQGSSAFSGTNATPTTVIGTVAVSTVQENLNVGQNFGSTAVVSGNTVQLSIAPGTTSGAESTTGGTVDTNSLSSTFTGNSSNNLIGVQGGVNPTFTGSLALSNISANRVDGSVDPTAGTAASNAGSLILGSILNSTNPTGPTTNEETLTGALDVSHNSISSSATGNSALPQTGSTAVAGNLIIVADGENFTGTAINEATGNINTIIFGGAGSAAGNQNADIVLFNSQSNSGSGRTDNAPLTSDTEGGVVASEVSNLNGGSVTMSTNAISSSATGNTGSNAIMAPGSTVGSTANFTGNAVLGSAQLNDFAPVTALLGTTTPNTVTATVGTVAGGAAGATAAVVNGSVALGLNSLEANATGNAIANTLDIAATTVAPDVGASFGNSLLTQRTDGGGSSESFATADTSIDNVQRISNLSSVTATNTSSVVGIDASGVTAPITGTSLTIGGIDPVTGLALTNTESASAVGNNATNSLGLAATTLSSTGAVVNTQTVTIGNSDFPQSITANLTNPTMAILAGNAAGVDPANDVENSSLLITENAFRSFAAGNQGINQLSSSGTTVIVAPVTGTGIIPNPGSGFTSNITYSFASADGLLFDNTAAPGSGPTAQGFANILTSQATNSPVTANITGTLSPVNIQVGVGGDGTPGSLTNSTSSGDHNTFFATAIGNEIAPAGTVGGPSGNTLTLSANALAQPTNGTVDVYAPLAGITNVQELGDGGSATANINTLTTTVGNVTGGAPLLLNNIAGDVTNSTVTLSNNLVQGLAEGNFANNNTLNVSGNSITDAAVGGGFPTGLEGLQISGVTPPTCTGGITAGLALTVVNAQSVSEGASVSSTVQTATGSNTSSGGYGALISVGGATTSGSTLAEANNVFLATAIDNNALSNTINITGVDNGSIANNIAVSAGVQNVQFSAADASASIGTRGVAGTPGTPGTDTVTIGDVGYSVAESESPQSAIISADTLTVTGNPLVFNLAGLTTAQVTALETLIPGGALSGTVSGGVYQSGATYTLAAGGYSLPASDVSAIETAFGGTTIYNESNGTAGGNANNLELPGTPATPGHNPTPSAFAQLITVNDPITNSTLAITSVPGTTPSGATAISNNANNTLALTANTVTASSGITAPNATVNGSTNVVVAAADYAVENGQVVVGVGPVATAYETLGIEDFSTAAPTPNGVTGSSLIITGNGLQAISEGNIANNQLSLALTNTAVGTGEFNPSAALTSGQYAAVSGQQNAVSVLQAYAPAAIGGAGAGQGSNVTISNNTNEALSVQNDAINTLAVTGVSSGNGATNVTGLGTGLASYTGGAGSIITATGAYTLNNTQQATGDSSAVGAFAQTQIFNWDNAYLPGTGLAGVGVLTDTSGLTNSSALFNNNVTTAEADANRANVTDANGNVGNTLTLTATNLAASAALVNLQDNSLPGTTVGVTAVAGVQSTALSDIELSLNGGDGTPGLAASNSSISISGNQTLATGRGNIAVNTLTSNGTANNGTGGTTDTASASVTLTPILTVQAGTATDNVTNNALANIQNNAGSVAVGSVGTVAIGLFGATALPTTAVSGSSIVADDNIVNAEADGNVSSSTMNLNAVVINNVVTSAGANLSTNGALVSAQTNSASITSTALGSISVVLNGGVAAGVGPGAAGTINSSIDVSNNQTVSTARGNSASNALNAVPSANFGAQAAGADIVVNAPLSNVTSTASYTVLNAQNNSGPVLSTANYSYTVSLNTVVGSPATVTGSSGTVSNNLIEANAYGNVANNTMNIAALNTGGASAALTNAQVNSGSVGAFTTGSTNSITVSGTGSSGSSFGVNANTIGAHAVGNSAVNSIVSH